MDKIFIANWKMNPGTQKEALGILNNFLKDLKIKNNKIVVFCPPFVFLNIFQKIKNKKVFLGAQDVSDQTEGAFTGQISFKMLNDFGVKYVILGHSEKRKIGETNDLINKKIILSLKSKITPIICFGENTRDNNGEYLKVIKEEIVSMLKGVSKNQLENLIFAYEPVWAIGKDATRTATKEEFFEIKIYFKKIISDLYDSKIANNLKIIYGGSVNVDNASFFLGEDGACGLLVGRDSLDPEKFKKIINYENN